MSADAWAPGTSEGSDVLEPQQLLLNELAALRGAHDRQIALLNAIGETLERAPDLDANTLADVHAAVRPETSPLQAKLAALGDELAALRAEVATLDAALAAHEQQHHAAAPRRRWWWRWRR